MMLNRNIKQLQKIIAIRRFYACLLVLKYVQLLQNQRLMEAVDTGTDTVPDVSDGDLQPFGERNLVNGSITNNLGFPGQFYDVETEQYYNWWRYYGDKLGRYPQRDPIGFAGGDVKLYSYVDSVGKPLTETNLYLYTGNNPVNYIDPLGLFSINIGFEGFLGALKREKGTVLLKTKNDERTERHK